MGKRGHSGGRATGSWHLYLTWSIGHDRGMCQAWHGRYFRIVSGLLMQRVRLPDSLIGLIGLIGRGGVDKRNNECASRRPSGRIASIAPRLALLVAKTLKCHNLLAHPSASTPEIGLSFFKWAVIRLPSNRNIGRSSAHPTGGLWALFFGVTWAPKPGMRSKLCACRGELM
jgi:hypothetical protein